MKTSELMLGDWVQYIGDGETQIRCVTAITDLNQVYLLDDKLDPASWILVGARYVRPIPLTSEILEKNGFGWDGSGQRSMMFISKPHFSEGQRFNIYVGLKHKTIEVFVAHPIEKSPNWRKSNKAYLEVCGPYVHELQHALRLCGIQKEIIL